jgi:uncharacterized protein
MRPIFVDTSALIALGNKRDAFHHQALRLMDMATRTRRNFVTSDAVLLEFGNAFSSFKLRPTAVKMIDAIKRSGCWKCVSINSSLIEAGFEKYRKVTDKNWGFIDCISMIAAEENDILEVFTTDHHFEQAGFTILLK